MEAAGEALVAAVAAREWNIAVRVTPLRLIGLPQPPAVGSGCCCCCQSALPAQAYIDIRSDTEGEEIPIGDLYRPPRSVTLRLLDPMLHLSVRSTRKGAALGTGKVRVTPGSLAPGRTKHRVCIPTAGVDDGFDGVPLVLIVLVAPLASETDVGAQLAAELSCRTEVGIRLEAFWRWQRWMAQRRRLPAGLASEADLSPGASLRSSLRVGSASAPPGDWRWHTPPVDAAPLALSAGLGVAEEAACDEGEVVVVIPGGAESSAPARQLRLGGGAAALGHVQRAPRAASAATISPLPEVDGSLAASTAMLSALDSPVERATPALPPAAAPAAAALGGPRIRLGGAAAGRLAAAPGRTLAEQSWFDGVVDTVAEHSAQLATTLLETVDSGAALVRGAWERTTTSCTAAVVHCQQAAERQLFDFVVAKLDEKRALVIAEWRAQGMPRAVLRPASHVLNQWWGDVSEGIAQAVLELIHNVAPVPPTMLHRLSATEEARCGRIRYFLHPFDKSVWLQLRQPGQMLYKVLCYLPYAGLPQLLISLQFFVIDTRDEYQLVRFIVSYKSAIFVASGLLGTFIATGELYACTVGLSATRVPPAPNSTDPGPSWKTDPTCSQVAPSEPLFLFAVILFETILMWAAFLMLPRAESKGQLPCDEERRKNKPREEMPTWRRLIGWLVYDLIVAAVCTVLLAWSTSSYQPSIQYDKHEWDWEKSKNWFGDESNWQFLCMLYVIKSMYGLASLPFWCLNLPGVLSVITQARPTGYTKDGICVPRVGLAAYTTPDGWIVREDTGSGRAVEAPKQHRDETGKQEGAAVRLVGGFVEGIISAVDRAVSAAGSALVWAASVPWVEGVSGMEGSMAKRMEKARRLFPWAGRAILILAVLLDRGLDIAAIKVVRPTFHDPYMPGYIIRFVDAIFDQDWPEVKEEILEISFSRFEPESIARRPKGARPRALCGFGARAFLRYRLWGYDRFLWTKLRDPVFLVWNGIQVLPGFEQMHLLKLVEFVVRDKTDEWQLIQYIISFKGLQFVTIGLLQNLVGVTALYRCATNDPPNCDHVWENGSGWAMWSTVVASFGFAMQVCIVWLAFCLLPGPSSRIQARMSAVREFAREKRRQRAEQLAAMRRRMRSPPRPVLGHSGRGGAAAAAAAVANPGRGTGVDETEDDATISEATHGGTSPRTLRSPDAGPSEAPKVPEDQEAHRLYTWLRYDMCVCLFCVGLALWAAFAHPNPLARITGEESSGGPTQNWRFAVTLFFIKTLYGCSAFPFILYNIPVAVTFLTHAKPTGYDQEGKCVEIAKALSNQEKQEIVASLREVKQQKDQHSTRAAAGAGAALGCGDVVLDGLLNNMMAGAV